MTTSPAASTPILLGTACATINPPLGLPLVGYPTPRPNTGVAMDLCVRAALFGAVERDAPDAVLIVIDTIGVGAELVRAIRERAASALPGLGTDAVMVAATHTHSAPRLRSVDEPAAENAADREYVQQVADAAVATVPAAWAARGEVRARVGRAEARLGHNRRVVDPAGKATNVWRDPDGQHPGYFNPAIRFVLFEDAGTGEVRAIFAAYGCHPVTLGPGNTHVSPDYAGYLVRALETGTGARTAIHITGAAANINPRSCLFDEPESARPMGEAIAAQIMAALPHARSISALPVRTVVAQLHLALGPNAGDGATRRAQETPDGKQILSEVQALRLGDLAFVSAPGELFAEIGTAIENTSPFDHTIIVGYANDSLGYLCTETAIREGGYEASRVASTDVERPILAAAQSALNEAADVERRPT
jgi:hypothetical protein